MGKAVLPVVAFRSQAGAALAQPATAQEVDIPGMRLFRFEFDNDTFLGSDDAFSAGWSIQIHSAMLDKWPKGLAGWIGRFPTLHDDGELVVDWLDQHGTLLHTTELRAQPPG